MAGRRGAGEGIGATLAGQQALKPVGEWPGLGYRDVVNGAQDLERCLHIFSWDKEPAVTALALAA